MVALLLDRNRTWTALAPAAPIVAILLATTRTKVYYGVRHVIVLYPLLAIMGGYGASYLWNVKGERRTIARGFLVLLLAGQIASSALASRDFIAYFNVFAGRDPSKIFVAGCDLDCGQDLYRLERELQKRRISHVTLALWTAVDISQTDLPPFDVAQPYKPVTGWFAISRRALRTGAVFHQAYPQDAFDWLRSYQPVQQVGETISLYYIPELHLRAAPGNSESSR